MASGGCRGRILSGRVESRSVAPVPVPARPREAEPVPAGSGGHEAQHAGKAPAPTMSDEHLRVIWQRWVAKASDVMERSAMIPDLLLSDLERLFKETKKDVQETRAP